MPTQKGIQRAKWNKSNAEQANAPFKKIFDDKEAGRMKPLSDWTKDEKSLLVYFEACLVDQNGRTQGAKMNAADGYIAREWNEEGFISFQGIPFKEMEELNKKLGASIPYTHRVAFTDEAWRIAHQLRRERAERHVPTLENASQESR